MATSVGESQIQRIIRDLQEAISELNREHKETGEPVTDDSTNLHNFSLNLTKGKTSFLGNRRDYWDYFCNCLTKLKGANDGIRFVKSIPELKTSLGKGRAFIRYSLVHQRLADTLQQCLMNVKVTSDWYYVRSPLLKPHLSSDIINHLYELNEVQLDLASRGHDLDAAWPTFARRSFGLPHSPSHLWKPPSRCSSISSLISNYSQAPEGLSSPEINNVLLTEQLETLDELRIELDQSEVKQKEMHEQIQQLEVEKEELQKTTCLHEQREEAVKKSIAETMEENSRLEKLVEELRKEGEASVSTQNIILQFQTRLQTLESSYDEKQKELQTRLIELETQNKEYEVKLKGSKQEMERIKASEKSKSNSLSELQIKLFTVEQKNLELIARIDNILTEKGQQTAIHYDSAQKIHELLDRLNEGEKERIGLQRLNSDHQCQLEKLTNDLKSKEAIINELELKLKETTSIFEEESIKLVERNEELEYSLNKFKETTGSERETADLQTTEQEDSNFKYEKLKATFEEQITTLSDQLKTKEMELSSVCNKAQNLEEVRITLFHNKEDLRKKTHDLDGQLLKLEAKLDEADFEHQKLQYEHEKLQQAVQKHLEKNKELEVTCLSLEAEVDKLSASEKQLQSQIDDASLPVDEREKKLREENKQLNENLQNSIRQIQMTEEKLKNIQSEYDNLKKQGNDLNNSFLNLQEDNRVKKQMVSELENKLSTSKQSEESLASLQLEMEDALLEKVNLLKQLSESFEKSQAKIEILEKDKLALENCLQQQTQLSEGVIAERDSLVKTQLNVQELTENLTITENQLEACQSEVTQLQTEICELRSKLKQTVEEKENVQSNLDLAVCSKEEYRNLVQHLKEQIESLNRDHMEELLQLKEKEDYLKKERDSEAQQITELKGKLVFITEELLRAKKQAEKVQHEHGETKELLCRTNTEMAELGIQICTLNSEKHAAEQKCVDISQQIARLREEVNVEQNQLNCNIATIEKERMEEELKKSEEITAVVKDLQSKLDKAEQQVKSFQGTAKEEISAIKFQMSGQVMDYQNKLKEICEELEVVKGQLNKRQNQISSMDEQVQKLQVSINPEIFITRSLEEFETVKEELREYKKNLQTTQEERERTEQKLLAEVDDLDRTKQFLEERLIELIKDKDALWQKSDALEFEQKLRTEARWLGDREVNHCLDCQSQFTWWLRRHHCRLCGRIFCYYCSNNFVMTKHSGKRERCCKACWSEHNAVVQRFSDAGSSSTSDSPDESPSLSTSERLASSNTETFTKPDDATFDIITDEELNEIEENDCCPPIRSQSDSDLNCICYFSGNNLTDTCIPLKNGIDCFYCFRLTIPHKVEEIVQFGDRNKELFIKSSCYSLIPIVVEESGLTINWVFSSEPKSISFSIVYQESADTPYEQCKVLIPLTRCNSHKETIQGQLKARNTGIYLLIFDNSFSRFTSKKVLYRLTVEKPIIYDGSDFPGP
uniref:FYVE and coiled-coil domain-containing protein 1 n=1 Tax=Callorhinchus milii TaxID=7868 RepID=A0A4W3ISH6_CALMI